MDAIKDLNLVELTLCEVNSIEGGSEFSELFVEAVGVIVGAVIGGAKKLGSMNPSGGGVRFSL